MNNGINNEKNLDVFGHKEKHIRFLLSLDSDISPPLSIVQFSNFNYFKWRNITIHW